MGENSQQSKTKTNDNWKVVSFSLGLEKLFQEKKREKKAMVTKEQNDALKKKKD